MLGRRGALEKVDAHAFETKHKDVAPAWERGGRNVFSIVSHGLVPWARRRHSAGEVTPVWRAKLYFTLRGITRLEEMDPSESPANVHAKPRDSHETVSAKRQQPPITARRK